MCAEIALWNGSIKIVKLTVRPCHSLPGSILGFSSVNCGSKYLTKLLGSFSAWYLVDNSVNISSLPLWKGIFCLDYSTIITKPVAVLTFCLMGFLRPVLFGINDTALVHSPLKGINRRHIRRGA